MKSFELQSFGVQLIALAAMVNHANFASAEKGVKSFQAGIDFFNYETAFREDGYPQPRDKFGPNDFGLNNFLPDEQYLNGGIAQEDIVEARNVLGLAEDNIWTRFRAKIHILNENSLPNVRWKVIYFARHGEGDHNVAKTAAEKAQIKADPDLTTKGVEEALEAREYWRTQYNLGMPKPDAFYISPFLRTLRTADITFSRTERDGNFGGIFPDSNSRPAPIITEGLRGLVAGKICDKRRGFEAIFNKYPDFVFESGFNKEEEDPYWTEDTNNFETKDNLRVRLKNVQEKIFMETRYEETYIHLTMHGGAIRHVLRSFQPLPGNKKPLLAMLNEKIREMELEMDVGFFKRKKNEVESEEKPIWTLYHARYERRDILSRNIGGALPLVYLSPGGMLIVVAKVTYNE